MDKLPGHFTITLRGVRPSSDHAKVESLAGSGIGVSSEITQDEDTLYALTRPVPFSVAKSICHAFNVPLAQCRWGDCSLEYSLVVDMPLGPNGIELLSDISKKLGGGSLPGIKPTDGGGVTKISGRVTPQQHGLDTVLYGLEQAGHLPLKCEIKPIPNRL